MFNFYHKKDALTIHFQKFQEGQGQGFPTWRAWVVVRKMEQAYNYYPQKSPNDALTELLKFINLELYYNIADSPFLNSSAEEEHF